MFFDCIYKMDLSRETIKDILTRVPDDMLAAEFKRRRDERNRINRIEINRIYYLQRTGRTPSKDSPPSKKEARPDL